MAFCFESGAKTVEVEGKGNSLRAAQLDAWRMAVEVALGTVLSSDTIIKNAEVLEDNIFNHSSGYVTNSVILSKSVDETGVHTILARVDVDTQPNSKLLNDLTKQGIIHSVLRNPKIAVLIADIKFSTNNSPAQEMIIKKMMDSGFTNMVDINAYNIPVEDFYEYEKVQYNNLVNVLGADILVLGRVRYRGVGDIGKFLPKKNSKTGVLSYQADCDAKMFIVSTGRIIGAETGVGRGVGITDLVAAKEACTEASTSVAESLVSQLFNEGSGQKQIVELIVYATDFEKINCIKRAFANQSLVQGVHLKKYSNGIGTFNIDYTGSTELLYKLIEQRADCHVQIVSSAYSSLVIKAY